MNAARFNTTGGSSEDDQHVALAGKMQTLRFLATLSTRRDAS